MEKDSYLNSLFTYKINYLIVFKRVSITCLLPNPSPIITPEIAGRAGLADRLSQLSQLSIYYPPGRAQSIRSIHISDMQISSFLRTLRKNDF